MSEPSVTRKVLRRAVAKSARMKFYLRYPSAELNFTDGGDSNTSTNDTGIFYCTSLTQPDGEWNNSYIWVMSTDSSVDGIERRVPNFNESKNALYLEWPVTTDKIPTTDDTFELLSIWPPTAVHDAINDAVRDAWRVYPEIITNEALIVEEDKKEYDLTRMARDPAWMTQIYIERSTTSFFGQITTVTDSDNFGDTTLDLSMVTNSTTASTDWLMSIYAGTGKSQLFELSAASTTTQIPTVGTSATTNPDTTSKIRMWNQNDQENWVRFTPAKFDRNEYPTKMYIQSDPISYRGLRWRFQYVAEPAELTADSDVTTVPRYYVLHKALSILHDQIPEDFRSDARRHMEIAENHDQLARDYALRNPRAMPDGTIWSEGVLTDGYDDFGDPLGWDRLG